MDKSGVKRISIRWNNVDSTKILKIKLKNQETPFRYEKPSLLQREKILATTSQRVKQNQVCESGSWMELFEHIFHAFL